MVDLDKAKVVINSHASKSICKTRFSPTINFNSLFDLVKDDSEESVRFLCVTFD